MEKQLIIKKLVQAHENFWAVAGKFSSGDFHKQFNGKWSVAQNVEHINKGLAPTAKYFSIPKEVIETKFGLMSRPSLPGDEALLLYSTQLARGTQAPERMIPGDDLAGAEVLINNGRDSLNKIVTELQNWSEEDLEKYVCPHTVIGKITPREMLYFIISHVEHHTKAIARVEELLKM